MTKKKVSPEVENVPAEDPRERVVLHGPEGLTVWPGIEPVTFHGGKATLPKTAALALVNDKGNAGKFRLA